MTGRWAETRAAFFVNLPHDLTDQGVADLAIFNMEGLFKGKARPPTRKTIHILGTRKSSDGCLGTRLIGLHQFSRGVTCLSPRRQTEAIQRRVIRLNSCQQGFIGTELGLGVGARAMGPS